MITDKQCIKCGQTKLLTEFYARIRDKNGYRNICKICWAKYASQYRLTEQGKLACRKAAIRFSKTEKAQACRNRYRQGKAYKNSQFPKHGITIAEYDELFEKQQGNCAICGLPEITRRLSIDHNHKTGEVRSLLCTHCNFVVGAIESDIFQKAVEYVNKYCSNEVKYSNSIGI